MTIILTLLMFARHVTCVPVLETIPWGWLMSPIFLDEKTEAPGGAIICLGDVAWKYL